MSKTLYFVAGESSGDTHGAALMNALRDLNQDLRFTGRGGPRMQQIAGGDFVDWTSKSSVMGLWEVIKQYGYFRQQFRGTMDRINAQQPDAVVLIDYPGFNLRLARALRAQCAQQKIIYYISPQVWAWNRGRIPRMAKYLNLMLCIFPFEAELYNLSGLRTVFVGHPMIESLNRLRNEGGRDPNLLGLFPGSRPREVRKLLPVMLKVAQRITREVPAARFEIAAASAALARESEAAINASPLSPELFRITIAEATAAMQRVGVGIVASGTATLEAAYFRLPFVVVYRVAWLTYLAALAVVHIEHVGMPNVLAGREIVPEFIQHRARPDAIADAVLRLMRDGASREQMLSNFDAIIARLGKEGASMAAARAILQEIGAPVARVAEPRLAAS